LTAGPLLAQDTHRIHVFDPAKKNDDTISARIKQESPSGIVIERGVQTTTIPVERLVDVEYAIPPALRVEVQAKAVLQEAAALKETDPAKRLKNNESAIEGYRTVLERLASVDGSALARRHTEYKIAEILARMAEDDPTRLDAAVKALTQFKTDHEKSWQISRVGKLLAGLQIANGDMKDAQATFDEFARRDDLPDSVRRDFELAGIRALMNAENFAEAERKLAALAKGTGKDDRQAMRVEAYLAGCKAKSDMPQAEKRLLALIQGEKTPPEIKALAYNTLGDCYRLNNRLEDAFWQYLWVDQEYNQDREEHAKALYWLSILFDKVKNRPDRAQLCRDRLLTNKLFSGLEFQRLAAKSNRPNTTEK
jgi:hypothetical protein